MGGLTTVHAVQHCTVYRVVHMVHVRKIEEVIGAIVIQHTDPVSEVYIQLYMRAYSLRSLSHVQQRLTATPPRQGIGEGGG